MYSSIQKRYRGKYGIRKVSLYSVPLRACIIPPILYKIPQTDAAFSLCGFLRTPNLHPYELHLAWERAREEAPHLPRYAGRMQRGKQRIGNTSLGVASPGGRLMDRSGLAGTDTFFLMAIALRAALSVGNDRFAPCDIDVSVVFYIMTFAAVTSPSTESAHTPVDARCRQAQRDTYLHARTTYRAAYCRIVTAPLSSGLRSAVTRTKQQQANPPSK